MAEISLVFQRMMKTYCAISKLEFLLEAVRLAYESVRDSRQPKKPMTDLGADGKPEAVLWVMDESVGLEIADCHSHHLGMKGAIVTRKGRGEFHGSELTSVFIEKF